MVLRAINNEGYKVTKTRQKIIQHFIWGREQLNAYTNYNLSFCVHLEVCWVGHSMTRLKEAKKMADEGLVVFIDEGHVVPTELLRGQYLKDVKNEK